MDQSKGHIQGPRVWIGYISHAYGQYRYTYIDIYIYVYIRHRPRGDWRDKGSGMHSSGMACSSLDSSGIAWSSLVWTGMEARKLGSQAAR